VNEKGGLKKPMNRGGNTSPFPTGLQENIVLEGEGEEVSQFGLSRDREGSRKRPPWKPRPKNGRSQYEKPQFSGNACDCDGLHSQS